MGISRHDSVSGSGGALLHPALRHSGRRRPLLRRGNDAQGDRGRGPVEPAAHRAMRRAPARDSRHGGRGHEARRLSHLFHMHLQPRGGRGERGISPQPSRSGAGGDSTRMLMGHTARNRHRHPLHEVHTRLHRRRRALRLRDAQARRGTGRQRRPTPQPRPPRLRAGLQYRMRGMDRQPPFRPAETARQDLRAVGGDGSHARGASRQGQHTLGGDRDRNTQGKAANPLAATRPEPRHEARCLPHGGARPRRRARLSQTRDAGDARRHPEGIRGRDTRRPAPRIREKPRPA